MENLETFESFFNKHKGEMKNNWGAWVPDNRYYYETKEVTPKYQNNFTVGTQECALNPGIMIGSENCSLCENYVRGETSFKKGKSWLICEKIDDATKQRLTETKNNNEDTDVIFEKFLDLHDDFVDFGHSFNTFGLSADFDYLITLLYFFYQRHNSVFDYWGKSFNEDEKKHIRKKFKRFVKNLYFEILDDNDFYQELLNNDDVKKHTNDKYYWDGEKYILTTLKNLFVFYNKEFPHRYKESIMNKKAKDFNL